jgi:hypothetical protein
MCGGTGELQYRADKHQQWEGQGRTGDSHKQAMADFGTAATYIYALGAGETGLRVCGQARPRVNMLHYGMQCRFHSIARLGLG